jgi:hypothetical protein
VRIRCVNHEKSLRQVLFSGSGFCASRSLIGALHAPCFKAPESSVTWSRAPRFYAHQVPVTADASIGRGTPFDDGHEGSEALGPVKEKLEDLIRQRTGFESGLEELDSTIASVKGKAVNQEAVLAALSRFKDIYAKLPPYQRRELIGLVLLKAEVTENQLRLSFHGRPAAPEVFEKISAPGARASRRAEPFEWLPGVMAQRASLRDQTSLAVEKRRSNRTVYILRGGFRAS